MDRTQFIGGSDIAAIVGLSPWASPLDVYLSKTEGRGSEVNDEMYWGSRLEPLILSEYEITTGRRVARPKRAYVDKKHPYIAGHLDGIVRKDRAGASAVRRVVEAKSTRRSWDDVPDYYRVQVQWYMRLVRAPVADVAALIAASEFRLYEIEEDREVQRMLVEAAVEFWERHVVPRVPPPPRTEEEVRLLWVAQKGKSIVASADIEAAVAELRAVSEKIGELEQTEKSLRDAIATAMLDAEELIAPDGRVLLTWRSSERATTDWKAVTQKLSEKLSIDEIGTIVGAYTRTTQVRSMRLNRE